MSYLDSLAWGWQRLRLKLNLQGKILAGCGFDATHPLYVVVPAHGCTRAVVEQNHYESAIGQITVLTDRIRVMNIFKLRSPAGDAVGRRFKADFKQIDVYQNSATGPQLFATTSPGAPRLDSMGATNWQPVQQGVSSSEITRNNSSYWLITADISNPHQSGFIQALVLKSTHHDLVDSLHREYNLFLFGAVAASVALLYVVFSYFFHRPVREILNTIAQTRAGTLSHARQ